MKMLRNTEGFGKLVRLRCVLACYEKWHCSSVVFVNENENENAKTAKLVTQRKC